MKIWRKRIGDLINQLISDEAVYRTAPATPDLLITRMLINVMPFQVLTVIVHYFSVKCSLLFVQCTLRVSICWVPDTDDFKE